MQRIRGPLAVVMCFSLIYSPEAAQAAAHGAGREPDHSSAIQGDRRIVHALNRFTFGPRPGDVEAVRAMGLERWFDQQLHPAKIDETDLNARLAAYPAMRWSTEELLRRLPSNALIRQAIEGKIVVPNGGILRAVYEDQMYRIAEKKLQKQDKAQPAPATSVHDQAVLSAMDAGDGAQLKTMDSLERRGTLNEPHAMKADEAITPREAAADPEDAAKVLALEPGQRVARLAAMEPAEADAFFRSLRGRQRAALVADMQPEQKETVGALENPERTVVEELIAQRLTRDIYSNAQLQEVMTDFWLNHFNVFLRKNGATPYYLVSYERDVIRPRALGKFEDLLGSVAHSPAMLLYLDNASSTGPDSPAAERAKMNAWRNPNAKKNREGLNENYARELMELHTLGVNGGYTQADVIQVARILSGWTVDRPQRGGGFRFDGNRHEPGTKKVMGRKFKEGGEQEGRELLHWLATRPATARFIAGKLAVRFVSDEPPASVVERMAGSYLSSGGDISAVLKTMFHSPEFWSASAYRAKVKTPLEYVVSTVRASHAEIINLQPLANALREMGMPLYGAVPPTGYKWDAADWVSTGALVSRMNFALSFAANRLPGITTTWTPASPAGGELEVTSQAEEARLEAILLADNVSNTTRKAVLQQYEAQNAESTRIHADHAEPLPVTATGRQNRPSAATPQERQDALLAGLLLGSPEFQRR